MINWRVRIKNRAFWLSLIPAVLLLLQQALRLCGVDFDPGQLEGQLTGLAGTVFSILALLGIVADPTTPGIRDCCEKHAAEGTENPDFSGKNGFSRSLRRKRRNRRKIRQTIRILPNIRREPPKGGPRP